jgi:hypothetical protein
MKTTNPTIMRRGDQFAATRIAATTVRIAATTSLAFEHVNASAWNDLASVGVPLGPPCRQMVDVTLHTGSATELLDLRSGQPVWAAYPKPLIRAQRLSHSTKADVVIVGAGISGALVAEAASAIGLSTVIIDRRTPGHGSTAASTALLQFEIDTPLTHLADQIGFERASRA